MSDVLTKQIGANLFRSVISLNADPEAMEGFKSMLLGCGIKYQNISDEKLVKEVREAASFEYGKYDPSIVPESLIPKAEDYVPVPYRFLSATIVAGGTWRATEFPENVLKASVKLIDGKGVFEDHWTNNNNFQGIVKNPEWVSASNQDGILIPAGIDGFAFLDTKLAPRLIRSILGGGVYSCSVTVVYDWKMSHDYSTVREFVNNVGDFHEDGTMIRRVATKIHDYEELSLLFAGADPFAKRKDEDGKYLFVDKTNNYHDSFSKEEDQTKKSYKKQKSFTIPCEFGKENILLSKRNYKFQLSTNKLDKKMNKDLQKLLCSILGLEEGSDLSKVTKEQLKGIIKLEEGEEIVKTEAGPYFYKGSEGLTACASIEDIPTFSDQYVKQDKKVANKVTLLEQEKIALQKKVTGLEEMASLGKKFQDDKLQEVIRLYKLTKGDNADDTVIELFKKADPEQLDALLGKHLEGATGKFTATCKSCSGTDITFKSSYQSKEGETNNADEVDVVIPTLENIRNKYTNQVTVI